MQFYTQYKGVWYKYDPIAKTWILSTNQDGTGNVTVFGGNLRIDECFDIYFKKHAKSINAVTAVLNRLVWNNG